MLLAQPSPPSFTEPATQWTLRPGPAACPPTTFPARAWTSRDTVKRPDGDCSGAGGPVLLRRALVGSTCCPPPQPGAGRHRCRVGAPNPNLAQTLTVPAGGWTGEGSRAGGKCRLLGPPQRFRLSGPGDQPRPRQLSCGGRPLPRQQIGHLGRPPWERSVEMPGPLSWAAAG